MTQVYSFEAEMSFNKFVPRHTNVKTFPFLVHDAIKYYLVAGSLVQALELISCIVSYSSTWKG